MVESPASAALDRLPGVSFTPLDLRDGAAMANLLRGIDAVAHLAALRTAASTSDPRAGFEVNVAATFDLVSAACTRPGRTFVYGSSHLVYGDFGDAQAEPYRESDAAPRSGLTHYAAAKLACEALMKPFSGAGLLRSVALRFGGIYGPGASPGSTSSVFLDVLDAIDAIDEDRLPAPPWSRDSVHALIHVDDAARSVVRALDVLTAGSDDSDAGVLGGGAVNVVGPGLTTEEIYTTLAKLAGADPLRLNWSATRARYQRVDPRRLRETLGCPPAVTLEVGLGEMVRAHRATRTQEVQA